MPDSDAIEAAVKKHYAAAARIASGSSAVETEGSDGSEVFGAGRYDQQDLAALPAEAVAASIGCANPIAVADLSPGEVVLDLGSGGGIDVLLSAQRVGSTGKAYGVDMTDEMLELARANQQKAGVANAEFLKGGIEDVPLPDESVDVIVSNCVINLSTDKPAVFAEAFRLLRPGGRLALADVVADAEFDDSVRDDLTAWTGCIAGAVTRAEYRSTLESSGFVTTSINESHSVGDGLTSVIVRGVKPADVGRDPNR